jgi:hypothetical protein
MRNRRRPSAKKPGVTKAPRTANRRAEGEGEGSASWREGAQNCHHGGIIELAAWLTLKIIGMRRQCSYRQIEKQRKRKPHRRTGNRR